MQKAITGLMGLIVLAACSQQNGSLDNSNPGIGPQAALVACNNFTNNPARLDRYFNPCKGYLQVPAPGYWGSRLAVHTDGSIAYLVENGSNWKIYRYSADGKTLISTTSAQADTSYGLLALQSDGKAIAVSGSSTGFWTVKRFNIDGSLDTAFVADTVTGMVTSHPTALVVQPDNKILVAGSIYPDQFAVFRYTQDGRFDTSFNATGYEGEAITEAKAMALAPDGKIVLAALGSRTVGPGNQLVLVRINPSGGIDRSFGSQGLAIDPREIFTDASYLAIQPDGKVLVSAREDNGIREDYLLRFEASGAIDASFGTNGETRVSLYSIKGLVLLSDGKILVQSVENIIRFLPNGTIDPSGWWSISYGAPVSTSTAQHWGSIQKLPGSNDRILVGLGLIQNSNSAPMFPYLIRLQN